MQRGASIRNSWMPVLLLASLFPSSPLAVAPTFQCTLAHACRHSARTGMCSPEQIRAQLSCREGPAFKTAGCLFSSWPHPFLPLLSLVCPLSNARWHTHADTVHALESAVLSRSELSSVAERGQHSKQLDACSPPGLTLSFLSSRWCARFPMHVGTRMQTQCTHWNLQS